MKRNPKSSEMAGNGRRAALAPVETALQADYLRYQYSFVDFLSEHLADVSRAFDGDLQMAVLLAVIGQAHLGQTIAAELGERSIDCLSVERRGISTNRLADVTGIARETARRKLVKMEEMGRLIREQNLWLLAMTGKDSIARYDLAGLDSRAIKRSALLFVLFSEIVNGN